MTTKDERDELRRILEDMVQATAVGLSVKAQKQRLTLMVGEREAQRILNGG